MFCTHCGAPIEGNQKFCTQCGAPVDLNMTGEYDNPYHVHPDTVGDEDLAIIRAVSILNFTASVPSFSL